MPVNTIQVPNKNAQLFQTVLPAAGAIIGGIYGGGPAGAAAGGAIGSVAAQGLTQNQSSGVPQVGGGQGDADAMMRRQRQLSDDNLKKLVDAEGALHQLPEEQRQQYAPAIIQARMLEQQRQGLA